MRCPCGCKIDGDDETERSRNFREHLIAEHGQDGDTLRMAEVREELGDETANALLSMEMGMKAHLAPTARSYEEILRDSVCGGGKTCVSEMSLTPDLVEDYEESIICPVCGRRVGGKGGDEASNALHEHCDGHEQLKEVMTTRVVPAPR